MLPVSKWVIAGCSMAGILCTTLPEQGRAAEALTPRLQTQILNMLASRDLGAGRCIPTQKMGNLIASHPASAQKIVEFTSGKLAARPDLLGTDCACPTELAAASIDVVPHMAGPLRRVLEYRYPDCAAAVETAMAHTLGGIAPGAGNTDQPSNSTLLRSAAAPNDGSDPTQISGLSGDELPAGRGAPRLIFRRTSRPRFWRHWSCGRSGKTSASRPMRSASWFRPIPNRRWRSWNSRT